MPYQPAFELKMEKFQHDLAKVRTRAEWDRFAGKWFDTRRWPPAPERPAARREIGGRAWDSVHYLYDISPAARYAYRQACLEVMLPVCYPASETRPGRSTRGWSQECPYDAIATREYGDGTCPLCGRPLLDVWIGEA